MKTHSFLEEVKRLCRRANLDPDKSGNNLQAEEVPSHLNPTPVDLYGIRGFKKPFVRELDCLGQITRNLISQIGDTELDDDILVISRNITDYIESILKIEIMVTKIRRKFVVFNGFIYEEKTTN